MLSVRWDMLLFPKAASHLPWNILHFTRETVYILRDILKNLGAILLNRLYLSDTLEDIFRSFTDILKFPKRVLPIPRGNPSYLVIFRVLQIIEMTILGSYQKIFILRSIPIDQRRAGIMSGKY